MGYNMGRHTTPQSRACVNQTVGRIAETLESRRLLSVNVLNWHDDLARTGLNSNETQLTPTNVNQTTFGKLFSYPVDGQVYAQPLYVAGLSIPGQGTHDVVFVATQHDSVYAFDADSNAGTNAGMLWHVSLGDPAAMPNSYFGNRYGSYHDIDPWVGITSTPVIDLASGTMYVDAFTNDNNAPGVYSHHIHALDITTGLDKVTPMLVQATYPGTGVEGDGTTITFAATQQLQRPALTLVNGTLYVAYGSYADTNPYHGWILGFDPATLQLTSVFNTTPNFVDPSDPNAGEGAIWQAGAGPASDGTNLFFMTGNGDFDASLGDYGDSFLRVSTSGSTLAESDYFTPFNQQQLANADQDLGSGGVMLLPDSVGSAAHPHLMIGSGKQGLAYLVDRDNLGQFNSGSDNVVQEVHLSGAIFSSPAYFNGRIYYRGGSGQLQAFSIANAMISSSPVAHTSTSYGNGPQNGGGSTPSISSNGNGDGIVWDIQGGGSAVLHAYDAVTLAQLYNSSQAGARDQLSASVKFTTPMIADGEVFVGTTNALAVFGLLTKPIQPPAAPTNLTAAALGPSQVLLKWVNNANNQSGFKVERSTDGINFTQIAVAQASATSYLDTTVSPSSLYYYRVRATNSAGDSDYTNVASVMTPLTGPQNDIGVNFASGRFGPFDLAATDTAGVVPISNWNNEHGATGTATTLGDSSGTPTAIGVAWQSDDNWDATQEANTDQFPAGGDQTLMAGYLDNFDIGDGGSVATSGSLTTGTLDGNGMLFTGLTAQAYDVYVYSLQAAVPRSGNISVTGVSSSSQFIGTTGQQSSYVQGTGNGNYLLFPDVTPAAGGDLLITPDGTSLRVPIQGVELVPLTNNDVINDATGGNTITLKQDATNHAQIDWTLGSQSGKLPITDTNGLTINDSGPPDTIVLDNSNGSPLPSLLTLNGSFAINGPLSNGANQKVVLAHTAAANSNQLSVNSLNIPFPPGSGASPGTLDLSDGKLLIHYTGSSPLALIQLYLASGLTNSYAILSSDARANPKFAIADTDSADPLVTGQPQNTILLSYAIVGDLNLSHKVDFTDFVTLARNYNQTNADWAMGDFNYDGKVDFGDFVALARNYNQAGPTVTAAFIPVVTSDVTALKKHARRPLLQA